MSTTGKQRRKILDMAAERKRLRIMRGMSTRGCYSPLRKEFYIAHFGLTQKQGLDLRMTTVAQLDGCADDMARRILLFGTGRDRERATRRKA